MKTSSYGLLLPAAWCACSVLSFSQPGDEYNLWGIGSIIGLWVVYVGVDASNIQGLMLPVAVAGGITMALLGFALDRIRVNRWLFGIIWAVAALGLVLWAVGSFPTYQHAIAKNGSLAAYVFSASNVGMYLAIILAVTANLGSRVWHRQPGEPLTEALTASSDRDSVG